MSSLYHGKTKLTEPADEPNKWPKPKCSLCDDTGWIVRTRDEDKVSGAERCECYRNRPDQTQVMLLGQAGIPPLYRNAGFDTFNLSAVQPLEKKNQMFKVVTDVMKFGSDYPVWRKPGILLVGPNGVGKTHLAIAALKRIISRGIPGLFVDYTRLLETVVASYNVAKGAGGREMYQRAMDCDVLLLDDVGAHRALDWAEDAINALITYRCNQKKGMILTTNLTDPEFTPGMNLVIPDSSRRSGVSLAPTLAERLGARSRSRLFEMCTILKFPDAGDYRPTIREQHW